jgi:hypothetical protein
MIITEDRGGAVMSDVRTSENCLRHRREVAKDAVTVIIYRHNAMYPSVGVLLYGECQNMNDHRNDTTAWIESPANPMRPVEGLSGKSPHPNYRA